jgi:hypothetical protein
LRFCVGEEDNVRFRNWRTTGYFAIFMHFRKTITLTYDAFTLNKKNDNSKFRKNIINVMNSNLHNSILIILNSIYYIPTVVRQVSYY